MNEGYKPVILVKRFCMKCYKTQQHLKGENNEEIIFVCIQCDEVETLKKNSPADNPVVK